MGPNVFNNIGNSMNNLNLNAGRGFQGGPPPPPGPMAGNPAVEAMRATLRGSGYTDHAIDEIIAAVITLANYGLFGFNINLGQLCLQQGMGGPGPGMAPQNQVTLANLANIMNSQPNNPGGMMHGNNMGGGNGPMQNNMMQGPGNRMGGNYGNGMNNGGGNGAEGGNPQVFGPVGSTTTTKAGGDTGEGGGSYYANSGPGPMGGARMGPGGDGAMFSGSFGNNGGMNPGFSGPNQNSFGLGTGMGSLPMPSGNQGKMKEDAVQKEIEIGEHIIGAVLGPGGKGIVEIQNFTGTNIQISKKGVFAPGTRNRVVTISGSPMAIQHAENLIRQRTSQEEANRTRQGMRQ